MMTDACIRAASDWKIKSDIEGRLRVHHAGLSDSLGIRRHCASVLHRTPWLLGHRINVVSSTVVVHYPVSLRDQVLVLLNSCFLDPFFDTNFESVLTQDNQISEIVHTQGWNQGWHRAAYCASLLLLDALFVLPPAVLVLAAFSASYPIFKEFIESFFEKKQIGFQSLERLTASTVDVMLSATLIGGGLARESIVDGFLSNTTSAFQVIGQNADHKNSQFHNFVERLKTSIVLKRVISHEKDGSGSDSLIPLGELRPGMQYELQDGHHAFLHSRIVDGELIVCNSLLDGSSLPAKITAGDELHFGLTVLQGFAVCEVLHPFSSSLLALSDEEMALSEHHRPKGSAFLNLVQTFGPPLQLGLGSFSLWSGLTEQAIACLAFDPVKDVQRSNLSSASTALLDMAIHQVHISDAGVLMTLSEVNHVLISVNALGCLGSFHVKEKVIARSAQGFDPFQVLFSIAAFTKSDPATLFWGVLEGMECSPLLITSLEVGSIETSQSIYNVEFEHGDAFTIVFDRDQRFSPKSVDDMSYTIDIRFLKNDTEVCRLFIVWSPDPSLQSVIDGLMMLGVEVSIVGQLCAGSGDESARCLQHVVTLQNLDNKVAYLGDVINDIHAMAKADIAIGMTDDEKGFISKTVCDVILGGDITWLLRVVTLSRRYAEAVAFNSSLIAFSSIATSLAAFVATMSPLQLIALFNLGPIIAEINTIRSFSGSSVRA